MKLFECQAAGLLPWAARRAEGVAESGRSAGGLEFTFNRALTVHKSIWSSLRCHCSQTKPPGWFLALPVRLYKYINLLEKQKKTAHENKDAMNVTNT